ncbi:RagB/SusD family nutrient uptake outer membrane protein [Winogradskyella sp. UBA3174]|uniref:RagB/SusD family nutrient uptake outer membrane protein n=1 Tax=Winogradskyella sp. UBA3174 TaxID=1947785 RepID=UPI0025EC49E5|nr:RagB/SusD family nutrient uptake outer membrane protein [Winogradskyella sp. UBA3174]
MKQLFFLLGLIFTFNLSFAQIMEVTHQTNGTVIQLPIESIDSVKINTNNNPVLKTVYQNNGNILGIAIQSIDSITYSVPNSLDLPILNTVSIVSITSNSAVAGGNVSSIGSSAVIQKGVCWSLSANPTIANSYTIDGSGLGAFTSQLIPLSSNTTYFFRSYATNASGTAYGNELSFATTNTDQSSDLPSVITNDILYDDGLVASGGGSVTLSSGSITSRGLCWAIGATPTINSNHTLDGEGLGTFTSALNDLLPNTLYRVRAYATSSAGLAYGEEVLFRTNDYASIFTANVAASYTNTIAVEASVLYDGNSTITERGLCWSTELNPTLLDNVISLGAGEGSFNTFLQSDLNLDPNIVYYFRPFATNGVGTSYGNSFPVQTSNTIINLYDIYDFMYQQGAGGTNGQDDFGQKSNDIFSDMLSSDMALSNSAFGWYRSGITEFESTQDEDETDANNDNKQVFNYYWSIILRCSTIIEALTPFDSTPTDEAQRAILGQALALRAHSYLSLLQFFQEDYNPNEAVIPVFSGLEANTDLANTGEVYTLIENDLTDAIDFLETYNRPTKKYINQSVAKAILAYVIASTRTRWDEVAALANDVLTESGAVLMPSDNSTFGILGGFNNVQNPSWLWGVGINFSDGLGIISWWGQVDFFSYGYASVGDSKAIDAGLYASMRADDIRRGQFLNLTGDHYLQPLNKQFDASRIEFGVNTTTSSDYHYMRYAEFVLLKAEAEANMNLDAVAKTTLNELVAARITDASYLNALSGQSLKDEIYKQTRLELWGEGKSYLAMKRNMATTQRGANHLSFVGEPIAHDDHRLTFDYSVVSPNYTPNALAELNCDEVVYNGQAPVENESVLGFQFTLPYTTNTGGDYSDMMIPSQNVSGLTASLDAGTFGEFEGELVFNVSGTPISAGIARFDINIGGRLCTVSFNVENN